MYTGCTVMVVEGGDISLARKKIFYDILKKNGGVTVTNISSSSTHPTHIVSSLPYDTLERKVGVGMLQKCPFVVTPRWLEVCNSMKKRVCEDEYAIARQEQEESSKLVREIQNEHRERSDVKDNVVHNTPPDEHHKCSVTSDRKRFRDHESARPTSEVGEDAKLPRKEAGGLVRVKLVTWNACGLKGRREEMEVGNDYETTDEEEASQSVDPASLTHRTCSRSFFEFFRSLREPNCEYLIGITETWLCDDDKNSRSHQERQDHERWWEKQVQKVFPKRTWHVEFGLDGLEPKRQKGLETLAGFSSSFSDPEGRLISASFSLLHAFVCYVPHPGQVDSCPRSIRNTNGLCNLSFRLLHWDRLLREKIARASKQSLPVIVLGDLNVHRGGRVEDGACAATCDKELQKSLEQTLETCDLVDAHDACCSEEREGSRREERQRGCTFWSRKHASWWARLDYMLASNSLLDGSRGRLLSCEALKETFGSDHSPVVCTVEIRSEEGLRGAKR
ncbi:hypothetical protein GUITHDRAFT_101940 [Guillardia theta CCMP2712]|uniref:BRCT domain-containing protein n=1 Tax=Guillardia theta (strain CCMP2712) TaxID=905079 RepID=L1JTY6_GUITC|nr:hypothetical protein GUITHDRAFT_101940 [Guillardia theta CCMP2712]EKX52031.1 hypothetical protein GUITHDRAFT_101940 [Guillardia theta CCMP2712]|eukprot:XP_005839011.1 hypothetical protein GUITHDRAFT_101940 [Guillardia theta CCMP2712]